MPRFFISHSSADKAIAVDLRSTLASEAWIDLFEIEVGSLLLEEISAGIENASDFVLLWSSHSAASKWVRFEFHMAFVKWLEDQAIALRIVCLDDTALPLYLRPFLQYRGTTVTGIAAALLASPVHAPHPRPFVNRNSEIDSIEAAFYSPDVAALWVWGVPGIGRRATVAAALRRVAPDSRRVRHQALRAGTSEVELLLETMGALGGFDPAHDRVWTPEEALDAASQIAVEFIEAGGIFVFENAQHWLLEDATPSRLLSQLLGAISRSAKPVDGGLTIFTTTRRPDRNALPPRSGVIVRLDGLTTDYAVALLRARGAQDDEALLRQAATQMAGHPLGLETVAGHLDSVDWASERSRRANIILAELPLTDATGQLLETLALVDGPLPTEHIAGHLKMEPEQLAVTIEQATSYSLVHQDEFGYLSAHAIVKEYFRELFLARPNRDARTSDLANRALSAFQRSRPGTPRYIDGLVATYWLLALAKRLDEAVSIRADLFGVLYETGVQLYHQEDYRTALQYLERVDRSSNNGLSAQLYVARCLAYLDRLAEARTLVDELLASDPRNHFILRVRGRIEFIARDWTRALEYFQAALTARPNYRPVLTDIGHVYIRLGRWDEARSILQDAVSAGNPTPFTLNFYSQTLEHFAEYDSAWESMSQAVALEPRNAAFRHRLGSIARQLGRRQEALTHFEKAVQLDPSLLEASISLASVLIDAGSSPRRRRLLVGRRERRGHRSLTTSRLY